MKNIGKHLDLTGRPQSDISQPRYKMEPVQNDHLTTLRSPSEQPNSKSQKKIKGGEKMSETILNAGTAGSQPRYKRAQIV